MSLVIELSSSVAELSISVWEAPVSTAVAEASNELGEEGASVTAKVALSWSSKPSEEGTTEMMMEVWTEEVTELGNSKAEVMTLTLSVTLVGISSTISVEEGISMSAVEAKIDSLAIPISVVLNVTLVGSIERL